MSIYRYAALETALREELATTRAAAKEELDGVKYTRRNFRQERDELQKRLESAEQRNSEMLKAVEQSIEWFERISSGDGSGHADLALAIRWIAKLTKPTESGASE